MKRALITSNEPGRICEVVDSGNEFEVHNAFSWVDVPDDTTTNDIYNADTGEITKLQPWEVPGFAEDGYRVARQIGYGGIGDQLDMLFKEVMATGTISNTGAWATHISGIKSTIPKDDPQAIHEWNVAYWNRISGNI
jgi:hypothetical protein